MFRSLRGADSFSYSYAYRQDGHEYSGIGKGGTKGEARGDAKGDTKADKKDDTKADTKNDAKSDTKGDAPKIVSEPHEDKAAASSNAGSSLSSELRTSIIPRTSPNDASSSTSGSSSASTLTAKDIARSGTFMGTPDRPTNNKDVEGLSIESAGVQPTLSTTTDGVKPTLPTSSTSTASKSTPGEISSKGEDSTGPREKANGISKGKVDSVNDSTLVTTTSDQVSAAKPAQQTGDGSHTALIASIIAACAAALILATAIGYVVVQRRAAMKATVA